MKCLYRKGVPVNDQTLWQVRQSKRRCFFTPDISTSIALHQIFLSLKLYTRYFYFYSLLRYFYHYCFTPDISASFALHYVFLSLVLYTIYFYLYSLRYFCLFFSLPHICTSVLIALSRIFLSLLPYPKYFCLCYFSPSVSISFA